MTNRMLAVTFLLLALILVGCQDPAPSAETTRTGSARASTRTPVPTLAPPTQPQVTARPPGETPMPSPDKVAITVWHSLGGELTILFDQMVAGFNASQDEILVAAQYVGDYVALAGALDRAQQEGRVPNIVHSFDLAALEMIERANVVPLADLLPDAGTELLPAAGGYFADEAGLLALPLNTSIPLLYYNADLFADAGIVPPADSLTFTQFRELCGEIAAKSDADYCVTFGQNGYYFEQLLANSGALFYDNNNGRTAPAGAALFNSPVGVATFTFLIDLFRSGFAPDLGSTWSETDRVFHNRDAAMILDTSADVALVRDAPFAVGAAPLPHADGSTSNGVMLGGGALWVIDHDDKAVNASAGAFLAYLLKPEQQIFWHTQTGYLPIRSDLDETDTLRAFWAANPQYPVALAMLEATQTVLSDGSPNYAVLGPHAGNALEARAILLDAYRTVLSGNAGVEAALDDAAAAMTEQIAVYNEEVR